MKFIMFLLLSLIFVSCYLPTKSLNTQIDSNSIISETTIEENDTLFVNSKETRQYIFETNNLKYLSSFGYTFWTVPKINNTDAFSNICVSVVKESGKPESGYGIIFCNQVLNGKTFLLTVMINIKGEYIIGKVLDNKFVALTEWTFCPYLNTGLGVNNLIKISFDDEKNEFVLYFNDSKITSFNVEEKLNLKDLKPGYVVIVSNNENFPTSSLKIIFTYLNSN